MSNKATKLLFITLILLFILNLSETRAQISWIPMLDIPKKDLLGISGSSHKDVFAVGAEGTIIYYNEDGDRNGKPDIKWQNQSDDQEKTKLNAVWRKSKRFAYAVGDKGTIRFKLQDNKWKTILQNRTYGKLRGIWGSSGKNIFAVGAVLDPSNPSDPSKVKGIILHSTDDGQNWVPEETENQLNGIWGSSKINIFAVGNNYTILHRDGDTWSNLKNLPVDRSISVNFKAVWGSSGKNIFAVGAVLDPSNPSKIKGIILHSTDGGQSWVAKKTEYSLNAIWGSSEKNVFAVGDKGTILHYDGNDDNKWSDLTEERFKGTNFSGVWVSQNIHVFIIGEDGIAIYSTGFWIKGKIIDACSGVPLEGAEVWLKQGNDWILKGTTGGQMEDFEYSPASLNEQNLLRFTASDYYYEESNVSLLSGKLIDNNTFLIPENGYEGCISGVIAEQQGSYYYPIQGVRVYLYKAVGCEFPSDDNWDDYKDTNSWGLYSFTGKDAGTYKVRPVKTGYTFTPQYPALLHTSPRMYDFTPSP